MKWWRSKSTGEPFAEPSAPEIVRDARGGAPTSAAPPSGPTTLFVDYPWGWLWWDSSIPLLSGDPDVIDGRTRYPDSAIDWALVARAVYDAVSQSRSDGIPDIHVEDAQVQVPYGLGPEEIRAVRWWLTGGAGRMVRLIEPHSDDRHLGDGRHRLWGTWHQFDRWIPIMSQTALYFHTVYPRDLDNVTHLVKASIADERRWWEHNAPSRLRRMNADYIKNLGVCFDLL